MSDKTIEGQINDDLDLTLTQAINADNRRREIERDLTRQQEQSRSLEAKAQRLRMSLYALRGEHDKALADANKDNNARTRELREKGVR